MSDSSICTVGWIYAVGIELVAPASLRRISLLTAGSQSELVQEVEKKHQGAITRLKSEVSVTRKTLQAASSEEQQKLQVGTQPMLLEFLSPFAIYNNVF